MRYIKTFENFTNEDFDAIDAYGTGSPNYGKSNTESGQIQNQIDANKLANDPKFAEMCKKVQEYVEKEVLPNLKPEEVEKLKAEFEKMKGKTAAEMAADALSGMQEETGEKNITDASSAINPTTEGIFSKIKDFFKSPKTQRFFLKLGLWTGIGAAVAGLIGMIASGHNTEWSSSPMLTQVHDYLNSTFGQAAGPVSAAMFFGGLGGAFASGVGVSNVNRAEMSAK